MKKYLYFILVLLSILFVCCGYTPEEKKQMNAYEETGVSNAIKYIEQKYGFTPSVIDKRNMFNVGGPVPDFSPSPNGTVHVTMEYEGKEFAVEISGEEDSLDGVDDYQKEEILTYLNDYIVSHYPIVKEAEFYDFEQDNYYFNELLTMDNFYDYVKDSYVIIKLCGNDVSEFPVKEFCDDLKCEELNVIEYKDESAMPLLFNSGIHTSSKGYDMDSILPYINKYLWYDAKNDTTFMQDVFTEYDDDIVVCTLIDTPVLVSKVDRTVSDDDLLSKQKYIGSYRIQSDAEDVWVYVPHSMVNKDKSIAFYFEKYEETSYETEDYDYIDNLVIRNDEPDGYNTSFIINICSDDKRHKITY